MTFHNFLFHMSHITSVLSSNILKETKGNTKHCKDIGKEGGGYFLHLFYLFIYQNGELIFMLVVTEQVDIQMYWLWFGV